MLLRAIARTTSLRSSARLSTTASHELSITPLIINGERRPAIDGRTYDVVKPGERCVTGRASNAGAEDCRAAIDAAAAAQPAWEKTPVSERQDLLLRVLERLENSRQKFRDTLHSETAVSPAWTDGILHGALINLRATTGMVSELVGRSYPSEYAQGAHIIEQMRALGVVLSIAPWNAPLPLSIRGLAIPLLCGNTVVLKGSEYTPATQSLIVEAFMQAGAPPGTVNYITTASQDSPARCAEMIAHPAVRKLTFTGSDNVGRALAGECAKHLKPAVFELGGKSAAVVLEDADVEHAARTIITGIAANSGQVCMSTERVVVDKRIASALQDAIVGMMKEMRDASVAGKDHKLSAMMPPLFTERAAENVVQVLSDAQDRGARIVFGDGKRVGSKIDLHLVTNIPRDSKLWMRETFGPVISFVEAENTAHAVELANDSEYTLTASLFTQNVNSAIEVASALRAGSVMVNGSTFHPEPSNNEFGLGGASGYGRFDVDAFTDRRSIVIYPQ